MMTYYILQLQAAIRGGAELLRSLDVQPIMTQIRNEECDWVRDSQLEDGWLCWAEAQTALPESGPAVLLLNFTGGTIADLFCLNKIMEDHPELQCAAFAEIEWESEEPYREYYTYCNETPGDGVCCGSEFTDGHPLTPSVLELTGHTGRRHAFSFQSFAEALRKNTPDLAEKLGYPPEKLEEHLEMWLEDGQPLAFHVCLSPEGALSLGAYEGIQDPKSARVFEAFMDDEADQDEVLAVYREVFQNDGLQFHEEGEGRHYRWFVLDEDGNEYFLHSEWNLCTARSDWGFPDDWDWVPFDWKEYFPLPSPLEEDEDWFEDDEDD